MDEIISAEEAREATKIKISTNPKIQSLTSCIFKAIERGEMSCTFDPGDDTLPDSSLEFVRSLGYEIWWNRNLLHYEISWEK